MISRETTSPKWPRRGLVGCLLLAVALTVSALGLGAIHTTILCAVTAIVAVAAVTMWFGAAPMRVRASATILVATAALLTGYTLLQAIPLPIGVLTAIAPKSADIWTRALTPLHEVGPKWVTLSLDPVATRVEVLRGIAYVLMFLASVRVASDRRGAGVLAGSIVVTAVVLGIASLLHPAFGMHKVFGVYDPGEGISDRHIAPLLNPNHLAAYMNIGFCVALGAALAPRSKVPRAISASAVIVLAGLQVWVASRGGVAAMILGALLVVWFSREDKSEASSRRGLAWAIPALLCAGSAVIMVLSTSDALKELTETDTSKLELIRRALGMSLDFPVFGVGRGAFESTFAAYRSGRGHMVFTHPEDVVAQWISEWGFPVALLAGGAIAFALRPSSMRARSFPAIGAWVALATAAIHNLVDFSSETPGVMLALVACAAIVTAGSGGTRPRSRLLRWSGAPRLVAGASAFAGLGAILLVQPGIGRELADDRAALRKNAFDSTMGRDAFHDAARAAMLRHPAEPYLPFAGALRASRARDESFMPWIERTLERAPIYPPAHLVLGRAIAPYSPSQARLEYRLASEQSPGLVHAATAEGIRLVRNFDDAMELVPATVDALAVLEQISDAIAERLPSTRERIDAEILARKPDAIPPLARRGEGVLGDLRAGPSAPWCEAARAECVRAGFAIADRLRALAPQSLDVQVLSASLRVEGGDARRGIDELSSACETVDRRVDCLMQLASLARRAHDDARAAAALERLTRAGCDNDVDCVRVLSFVAGAELARGNTGMALNLYKKALARTPDDESLIEAVAMLAVRMGLHGEALEYYRRLAQLHPTDARWAEGMNREKAAAMTDMYKPPR